MKFRYYALLALALVLFAFTAKSATSYTVYNVPPLRLSVGISGSQTANIKLSAPIRNGESVSYPALTGGILQLKNARFEEHIYYASGSVASSTLEVTLYGVVRGYCWNSNTFASCEAGRTWAKGTETTLVNDMRLFNFSAKKDIANVLTASGALTFSGSGSLAFPTFATTTTRDQQLGASPVGPVRGACVTDTGLCYLYYGGAWTAIGDTGTANASETTAGKAEAADFDEVGNLDQTGSTLALVFLTPRHLVKNGSGATSANLIPLLNGDGVIPVTMGGTGTGGTVGVASGSILVYQGTGSVRSLRPSGTNQVIVSTDGTNWGVGSVPQDVNVLTGTTLSSNTITNAQVTTNFNQTGSLTATELNTQGKMIHIIAAGQSAWGAGTMKIKVRMSGTVVGNCEFVITAGGTWSVHYIMTIRSAGASGVIQSNALGVHASTKVCAQSLTTSSFDTTTNKTVNITAEWTSSNGSNTASLDQFIIDGRTP